MALLGRTTEKAALSRVLAAARLGQGGALVVVGEPGVGKTSLLGDALPDRAARAPGASLPQERVRVLEVTGTEAEQDLPFAALHALLLPALGLLDDIPQPQAEALGAALTVRPGGGGPPDRFAIGAATLSLLSRYADDAPVVVVVDDVQWVDRPSVEAMAFAARRVREDPVAVLVAVRSGELPSALKGLPVLDVAGLGVGAAAELLTATHPSIHTQRDVERLHRATNGNPLALLELGGDRGAFGEVPEGMPEVLPTSLPRRLAATFDQQVRALPKEQRQVALVAAVTGGDLRLTRAASEALELDADVLDGGGLDARVLSVRGDRIVFRHPVLRAVVHASAREDVRRRVHLAVSEQLGSHAVGGRDEDRRVWHLAAGTCGLDETVAAQLDALGMRASARSAFTVASTARERAARLSPDPAAAHRRLLAAASAAWTAGEPQRARDLIDEAEPASGTATGRASASGLGLRAEIAARSGSLRQGLQMFERAATMAPANDAVLLLAQACHAGMYLSDTPSLRRCAVRLADLLPRVTDPEAAAVGRVACGLSGVMLGEDDAESRIRAALPLLATGTDPLTRPALLPWLMLAPLFLRDADSGEELRALADHVRARVGIGTMPNLLFHVARDQATSDAWDRATANYDEAVRLARETGQETEEAMSLAGMASLESRQGRSDPCREHAEAALSLCTDRSLHFGELWCHLAVGGLALSLGAADEAVDRLRTVVVRLESLAVGDPDLHPGPELVEALVRTGEARAAREVALDFTQRAGAMRRPWARARAGRARGLVATDDELDEVFHGALALHARTRDPFETARTELVYGARLRRAGRRVDARVPLKAAVVCFDGLGAVVWAAQARAELGATGERVPPRDRLGSGSLTPQELQVCLLLAEGHTTREAAAALFLSPKTVEYHLRKAYTKLGVHSRSALADVLAPLA